MFEWAEFTLIYTKYNIFITFHLDRNCRQTQSIPLVMANLWTFQIQISILVFVYCAEKSPVANRRYGVSLRTTPYNELLHEKAIKQEFMRKILAKLGMAKRPPLIPYDQRKPNIPRPVIDGGISTATKEDIENKIQIMIASEEGEWNGEHSGGISQLLIANGQGSVKSSVSQPLLHIDPFSLILFHVASFIAISQMQFSIFH